MISFKINGRDIQAAEGTTVLEAARHEGIDIPTLCYLKALGPYGVCRLCVVEAEGPRLAPTILPSCNLTVTEGLIITTDSPVLQEVRRDIIELLLVSIPLTDTLREVAKKLGVQAPRFKAVKRDPCILCGLCVRVCREKIGASALSFLGSSENEQVVAEQVRMDGEACIGCGTCANICPVRTIQVEDSERERTVILYGKVATRCELVRCERCGVPCTTQKFMDTVLSRLDDEQKRGFKNLCPECSHLYYAEALTGQFPTEDSVERKSSQ